MQTRATTLICKACRPPWTFRGSRTESLCSRLGGGSSAGALEPPSCRDRVLSRCQGLESHEGGCPLGKNQEHPRLRRRLVRMAEQRERPHPAATGHYGLGALGGPLGHRPVLEAGAALFVAAPGGNGHPPPPEVGHRVAGSSPEATRLQPWPPVHGPFGLSLGWFSFGTGFRFFSAEVSCYFWGWSGFCVRGLWPDKTQKTSRMAARTGSGRRRRCPASRGTWAAPCPGATSTCRPWPRPSAPTSPGGLCGRRRAARLRALPTQGPRPWYRLRALRRRATPRRRRRRRRSHGASRDRAGTRTSPSRRRRRAKPTRARLSRPGRRPPTGARAARRRRSRRGRRRLRFLRRAPCQQRWRAAGRRRCPAAVRRRGRQRPRPRALQPRPRALQRQRCGPKGGGGGCGRCPPRLRRRKRP